uniref:PBECR2 nuclease fold domain-containing protein n=1 Tax=Marinobacterium profundum TaxID=1714300 RepID=UPI00082BA541|nr:PBECR2 nuclease fold domain-containing protein [Marinobacterium profundum]
MPLRVTTDIGARPFDEAIKYFSQKLGLPTNGWQDVYGAQHDHAFMVAGANKQAIVEGFATAITAAIEQGETLAAFRERFDDIVATHGWDYKGSRGWRSRLIYETNVRQSYNAGREVQMADPAHRARFPYMEYRHSGAENYRPQHKAWDRLVLSAEDPWWNLHSPSNGYGCKCKKLPVSKRELKRLGKTAPDTAPADEFREFVDKRSGEVRQIPLGIDPGFDHRPGESWLRHNSPSQVQQWPAGQSPIPFGQPDATPMPSPTQVRPQQLLDAGLSDDAYIDAFVGEFHAAGTLAPERQVFRDVLGEPLLISEQLFQDARGQRTAAPFGSASIDPQHLPLLAQAIQQPDEIWAALEPDLAVPGKYRLTRRYLSRWITAEGQQLLTRWVQGQGLWHGATGVATEAELAALRQGVLLYQRGAQVTNAGEQ